MYVHFARNLHWLDYYNIWIKQREIALFPNVKYRLKENIYIFSLNTFSRIYGRFYKQFNNASSQGPWNKVPLTKFHTSQLFKFNRKFTHNHPRNQHETHPKSHWCVRDLLKDSPDTNSGINSKIIIYQIMIHHWAEDALLWIFAQTQKLCMVKTSICKLSSISFPFPSTKSRKSANITAVWIVNCIPSVRFLRALNKNAAKFDFGTTCILQKCQQCAVNLIWCVLKFRNQFYSLNFSDDCKNFETLCNRSDIQD